jgi:phosphohistidine swiveling domain-containing protein
MPTDHIEFYKQQISLTEWLEKMGHRDAVAMRREDNDKRERLKVLGRVIGLPFDEPYQFPAAVVAKAGPEFQAFLDEHGDELCAIRLMPSDPTMPKLRMRGHSIREAIKWFADQAIDPEAYRVDFVPHSEDNRWSTIFVVNQHGIFGEVLYGSHNKLTQGLYEPGEEPISFRYDFNGWHFEPHHEQAAAYIQDMVQLLQVTDQGLQTQLASELDAKFAHDYLCGYFETTNSGEHGTWFIDYNRILGDMYAGYIETTGDRSGQLLRGQVGSPGKARGPVKIVMPADLDTADVTSGDILVCRMTTPDYLPLMQRAAAIVTDLGGMLSHAAIVARELGKPCLVATRDATSVLRHGDRVEVDADAGVVRRLEG